MEYKHNAAYDFCEYLLRRRMVHAILYLTVHFNVLFLLQNKRQHLRFHIK